MLLPDQKRDALPNARSGDRTNSMTIPLEPCPAGPSFCDASLEHVWYANDFSDTPRNGPRKHGCHVVLLQDAARIENHAVIAQVGRLIDVVGDKERSNLLFIEDVREFLAKAGARGGVERSERLVQEEDFGFENKGAGEACALRFSAGKRANRPIAKMRDAQSDQARVGRELRVPKRPFRAA